MNAPIRKWDESGREVTASESRFSEQAVRSGAALRERSRVRGEIIGRGAGDRGKAPPSDRDQVADLVDAGENAVFSLPELEKMNLKSAALATVPWSDSYWPYYQGILGARYADPGFPTGADWMEYFRYVGDHPVSGILAHGNAEDLERLSPAEKYDLLTGDTEEKFTRFNWNEGKRYHDRFGKVESWFGVCHGWAAASFMVERPTRVIDVPSADGKRMLRFFPSDIKALVSYLWANVHTQSRFVGERCEEKEPAQDENGRTVMGDCFDSNPGTWHLAVTNQIGISKRSFIMDATYDYEVWNQPIVSYSYRYFHPETMKAQDTWQTARVRPSDFKKDKFKKYRSSQTRWIVGILMNVTYSVETQASHALSDGPDHDATRTVQYVYDLELSESGDVMGGEWYQNRHPDFLWVPVRGAKARAYADSLIPSNESWNGLTPIPASWKKVASQANRIGQPLGRIVETLVERSR